MKTNAIALEDKFLAPFFDRTKLTIERGEGVYVWDDAGKRYLDFTAGWGVTCIGHANPVITEALVNQGKKIIQNPNSGLTYSPVRAELLSLLAGIVPHGLTRIFFGSSGAEVNDAAIKLARKVSGKLNVVSMEQSFHGRTISTASATGQAIHREKYNPLMPNYLFVPFNDVDAIARVIKNEIAAVILEPIQGEGGVIVPDDGYLQKVSELCREHGVFLMIDEIQTGFCRTGPFFASALPGVAIDFLTMAKGIAGGFPFAAFAVTENIAAKFEKGDHGGTYCGNPLGCAVSLAVIKYLLDNDIQSRVEAVGAETIAELGTWQAKDPGLITGVRGKGLLIALQVATKEIAAGVSAQCLRDGLILNVKQGNVIRLFPALTVSREEMRAGLAILRNALKNQSTP
jgi:acetylornithine/N-succinyldiaminopimelate aminotransferase